MHKNLLLLATVAVLSAPFLIPASAQDTQGREITVTVTSKVQMPGMTVPPRTVTKKVCMAARHEDLHKVIGKSLKGNCKLSDYKVAGDTVTYDVACTEPMVVNGKGTLHRTGNGGFSGTQHMTMLAAGRKITTDTTYDGTPTGRCVYKPPTK